jgi:hypothetical protein
VEQKKKRRRLYYETLRTKTEQAKSDIARGIGYYRAAVKAADAPEKVTTTKDRLPCRCGSITHQRISSLQCPLNKAYVNATPELIEAMKSDQNEQSIMDTLSEKDTFIAAKIANLDDNNITE